MGRASQKSGASFERAFDAWADYWSNVLEIADLQEGEQAKRDRFGRFIRKGKYDRTGHIYGVSVGIELKSSKKKWYPSSLLDHEYEALLKNCTRKNSFALSFVLVCETGPGGFGTKYTAYRIGPESAAYPLADPIKDFPELIRKLKG